MTQNSGENSENSVGPLRRLSPRQRRRQLQEVELRLSNYHQARILLLVTGMSGSTGSLRGLTKLAKLDFLLRYPTFLAQLLDSMESERAVDPAASPNEFERSAVESRMIRYKYGPWDDRYYGIIGSLVGKGLLEYVSGEKELALRPTKGGRALAETLSDDPAWRTTSARVSLLRAEFGRTTGNKLKNLVYDHLPDAVNRPRRGEI